MSTCEVQLNSKEKVTLDQFRHATKDCNLKDSSDDYLVKWLIVQDFNLERAEKMLRQSLEWRKMNEMDKICDSYTPPEVYPKYFAVGHMGIDKFGCPVYLIALGRIDIKGLFQCTTKKERNQYMLWLLESFSRAIENADTQSDKKISHLTLVLDVEELSMKQLMYKPGMDHVLDIVIKFLSNYPSTFRKAFVINAPKIFSILFAMVKPFLHATDIPKIKIYGSDRNEWTSVLLEDIEADQLAAYYGGTMTDPDGNPKCPSKFNMGGEIPKTYYLSNSTPIPKDNMQVTNVKASAGGKKKFEYQVDIVQSTIRWEFITEGGDIGFRLYFKNANGEKNDLVPYSRIESNLVMEEGEFVCDQIGKYVVEFDNTFSYLKPKKLHYDIVINAPSLNKLKE